jgi:DNA-binding CsgD family transcriptional regulator
VAGLLSRALVLAWLGDVEEARRDGDRAIEMADGLAFLARVADSRWVRGFVELSAGDPAAAHHYLGPAVERVVRGGTGPPGETCPALPRFRRDARRARPARRRGTPHSMAGTRCGETRGHGPPRRTPAASPPPRRGRRRWPLSVPLSSARLWAEAAAAELGSIGGRRREEGLTAAERRVAALVAEGKTNREVAAALFLGERTVATHLSHVYAKLGIRSRTELARALR